MPPANDSRFDSRFEGEVGDRISSGEDLSAANSVVNHVFRDHEDME